MRLTPFLFPVWIVLLPLAGAIAQTTQPEAGASGGREDLSQYYTADVQRQWGTWVEPDFPFFSSAVDARGVGGGFPKRNMTPRALVLPVGRDLWVAWDTDLLRVSLVWQGKEGEGPLTAESMATISYINAKVIVHAGQSQVPKPVGKPLLANGIHEGWKVLSSAEDKPVFVDPRTNAPTESEVGKGPLPPVDTGLRSVDFEGQEKATLSYDVEGTRVVESFHLSEHDGHTLFFRRFELAPHERPLAVALSAAMENAPAPSRIVTSEGKELQSQEHQGVHHVIFPPAREAVTVEVGYRLEWEAREPVDRTRRVPWTETVSTSAVLSQEKKQYVMDQIPLPLDNPWKRNVRLADIAFLNDRGDAAAVSFDGDVWLISGLQGDLQDVRWRRFTSGFQEPMSIVHRKKEGLSEGLFVFDRNGIWRLLDRNDDGLADGHELFSNRFAQTAETREYANSMALAPDGSFVISKGGQRGATLGKDDGRVLRISPDGKTYESLGWGFRQPFVGVDGKTGLVVASDQQGNYIPSTPLYILRDNRYHGFLAGSQPKEQYPAPIADPLTWIPHPVNPSAITLEWAHDERFGPLAGACILVGFNRPELFHVLFSERFEKPQGAVISLSRDLPYPPLNATMNPADGQLYATGFQTFATTARDISGFSRFRFTGRPGANLMESTPMKEGVLLRFDAALEEASVKDLSSYSVERWNYKRTPSYGSPHLKLDGSPGSNWMTPSSVYLSSDRHALFLGLPDMRPVMQMRVGWAIRAENGTELNENVYFTPFELAEFDPVAEGFGQVEVDLSPREAKGLSQMTPTAEEGKKLSEMMGCLACHSVDGSGRSGKIGPTWKGLYGQQRALVDESTVQVDDAYLHESIVHPAAKVSKEFKGVEYGMPIYEGILTESQVQSLVLYIKNL